TLGTAKALEFSGDVCETTEKIGNGLYLDRDIDAYKITLESGKQYAFEVSGVDGGQIFDSYLRIFDASGNELASDDDSGEGKYSKLFYSPEVEGEYYAVVSSYANRSANVIVAGGARSGETGDYRLSIVQKSVEPDDVGDTLQTAEIVEFDDAQVYSKVEKIGNGPFEARDVDVFQFEADGDLVYNIAGYAPAGGEAFDAYFRVFDVDGVELAAADSGGETEGYPALVFLPPAAGTYYVAVTSYGNRRADVVVAGSGVDGETGDYGIRIAGVSKQNLTEITISTTAPTAGLPVSITSIAPAGATADYAWYRVVEGGDDVLVSTETSYTPTYDDAGRALRVVARGTGAFAGTVEVVSSPVRFVQVYSTIVDTLEDVVDPDDNYISLREAVLNAGRNGLGSTIAFSENLAGKTVNVSGAPIVVDHSLTLDGGTLGVSISGGEESGIFAVVGENVEFDVSAVTLKDGAAENGAAIRVDSGLLSAEKVVFENNVAQRSGGAIYNSGKTILVDCVFAENSANLGGAVANAGILRSTGVEWRANTAAIGGAIAVSDGRANDSGSTFESNSATNGGGGAVYVGGGAFDSANSVWRGNSAVSGGGVANAASATVVGGLFVGNKALGAGDARMRAYGGGVYNAGELRLVNATLSTNEAVSGGAVYSDNSAKTSVYNTIAAFNPASASGSVYGPYGGARNIIDYDPLFVVSPVYDEAGVLTNADALDFHLTEDSRGVNYGDSAQTPPGITDLEGSVRIQGVVDLGVYESAFDRIRADDELVPTVVTTLEDAFDADDGEISLREAVFMASNGATITFASGLEGTISLDSAIDLVAKITIDGDSRIAL
ncbi:MAG: PPC domain-containing protein, partial [Thermoguttaceae bacterium]|nr:PPC domain-containing protein [Thermoguttaceae bacterium]